MRDDDRGNGRWGWMVAVAVAAALQGSGRAEAQTFSGAAQLQYQKVERVGFGPEVATWGKILDAAYGRRLPGEVELSSRFRFLEQTVAGRQDRVRTPEMMLRLAHRYGGMSATFQPSQIRDVTGLTTDQQTLALTANAQLPSLPTLAGSWIRTRLDTGAQDVGRATVTRNLSSNYMLRKVALRAGYGDRASEDRAGEAAKVAESHVSLGGSTQFQVGRAPVTAQYDFGRARAHSGEPGASTAYSQAASAGTGFQITRKLSTGLNYSYQRTDSRGLRRFVSDDHNGALSFSFNPNRSVQLSSGAGVRSARVNGRSETERFVTTGANAQAQARPGWTLGASAGRSYNWLPGESYRSADNVQTNTWMRLRKGLELRGSLALSAGRRPFAATDTTEPQNQVGLQASAAVTANPLPALSLNATTYRSQTGPSLARTGTPTTAYTADARVTPYAGLQLSGGWSLTRSVTSRGTTEKGALQWTASPSIQASGTYARSRQTVTIPGITPFTPQESFTGQLVTSLARNLTSSLRYSEGNWGRPGHTRQVNVDIVRRFGR